MQNCVVFLDGELRRWCRLLEVPPSLKDEASEDRLRFLSLWAWSPESKCGGGLIFGWRVGGRVEAFIDASSHKQEAERGRAPVPLPIELMS